MRVGLSRRLDYTDVIGEPEEPPFGYDFTLRDYILNSI